MINEVSFCSQILNVFGVMTLLEVDVFKYFGDVNKSISAIRKSRLSWHIILF